ncbi:hypothetical protein [Desulfospira joergensenii]|uniref:hypothetical protein n=1 Tax=Desulfospira joergensenii TaxID=53329 RepID=UPI0003B7A661|nr:hypothetical protein [Desulfospira joergensenii]
MSIKWFNDENDKAKSGTKSAVRALQAWQYLIGKASNRQISRYKKLTELMEYNGDNRPVRLALGCIMFYCQQNDLPALTVIVVNKEGVPGKGFTAVPPSEIPKEREKVFSYQWYKLMPPTVEDFVEARKIQNQG